MQELKPKQIQTTEGGLYNISVKVTKRVNDGLKKLGYMHDLRKA